MHNTISPPAIKPEPIPLTKIVATGIGLALCGVEVWLNAEHIAHTEGWASSLVAAVIAASIGAAAALPLAERAAKSRQTAKAAGLTIFFALMVAFSFTASVDRVGGRRDGETAAARGDNARVALLREGYEAAKKTAMAECATGQGRRCRAAEDAENKARDALAAKPAERVEDSMALRISSALPFVTAADVELYQPLVLPLGLQLGGFLMLALGLSPKPAGAQVVRRAVKRRDAGEGPTLGGTPLPGNVTRLTPRKRDVRAWLESATVAEAGAEVQAGTLRKEFRRATGGDIAAADLRAILQAILPAGAVIGRNSGYVVAGRRLKTAAERREPRRAAI